MDDDRDRSPVEALCDLFVYAPLGFALEMPKLLPELAAKGRNQVAAARTVGRFVVSQAGGNLGSLASSVAGGVLRGLSGSRSTPTSPPPPAPAAPEAVIDSGPVIDTDSLDDLVVDLEAEVAALEADVLGGAPGTADSSPAESDGHMGSGPPSTRPRRSTRPQSSGGTEPPPAAEPAEGDEDGGDGLSGAPVSDDEVPEPDLDAPRPADDPAGASAAETADDSGDDTADEIAPTSGTPTGVSGLAIPEYDSLAASQVVPRLNALSHDELSAVRSYEAAHRGRRTILSRADQLLARSGGSGF